MKYRTLTFYTDEQKSEMWDRWQRGNGISATLQMSPTGLSTVPILTERQPHMRCGRFRQVAIQNETFIFFYLA